jgi:hypothetical protein
MTIEDPEEWVKWAIEGYYIYPGWTTVEKIRKDLPALQNG